MPHINQMKSSNFLSQGDATPNPLLLTMTKVSQENVAKEGAPEELKWCLHFAEHEKPMVLNSTNTQIIAGFTKCENTDDWVGKKVVVYVDPNVSFGGRVTGGLRVRQPKNKPAAAPAPAAKAKPAPEKPDDDGSDIPF
jgi:hypothetical protein